MFEQVVEPQNSFLGSRRRVSFEARRRVFLIREGIR